MILSLTVSPKKLRRDRRSHRLSPACRALSVELEPVPFNLVPRSVRELTDEIGDGTLIEIAHAAATGADEVVVMLSPLGDTVVKAAVVEEDTADDAEVREQANGAEDRRATGTAAAVEKIVDAEVAGLLKGGGDDRAAGRRDAVAARFELKIDGFEVRHDTPSQ
jgi:hypothetical protein